MFVLYKNVAENTEIFSKVFLKLNLEGWSLCIGTVSCGNITVIWNNIDKQKIPIWKKITQLFKG